VPVVDESTQTGYFNKYYKIKFISILLFRVATKFCNNKCSVIISFYGYMSQFISAIFQKISNFLGYAWINKYVGYP